MSTVRMRFPAQALEELRKDDPATPVTLNLIRTLIRREVIPSVQVGRGRLNLPARQPAMRAGLSGSLHRPAGGRLLADHCAGAGLQPCHTGRAGCGDPVPAEEPEVRT